uniref:EF-hand domain-containing protein n=1 Tax=Alexandrium monilatum TaxID=311494 RepID=A0A7S4SS32_9DINO
MEPLDSRMQPHNGDGRAEWAEPVCGNGVVQDPDLKSDPRMSPRILDSARSSESCSELDGGAECPCVDSIAEERELLASLLEACTKQLEKELRRRLQQQRMAMEDAISQTLESFRREASYRCSPERKGRHVPSEEQQGRPTEPAVREVFAPEAVRMEPKPSPPVSRRYSPEPKGRHVPGEDQQGRPTEQAVREAVAPEVVRTESQARSPLARSDTGVLPPRRSTKRSHFSQAVQRDVSNMGGRPEEGREDGSRASRLPSRLEDRYGERIRMLYPSTFIHGTVFNLLSAALILSNAVFIGYQTHAGIGHQFGAIDGSSASEPSWQMAETIFLVLFTLELMLRIGTDRLAFIRGVEWRWNLFDSVIVGFSLVETVAESILRGAGLHFPFLRLVRVVRVLRVLKVLHMIPFFKRLGLMMTSVAASLSALAPAFVLLILVIYMFGICMMQGVITHLETNTVKMKEAWLSTLEFRFGTISATMQTMFMSITGGLSWVEVLDGLSQIDGLYHIVYMFYVGFVQICVLNIVTGVFVDTVHQMYQPERSEMIEKEAAKRKSILQKLTSLLEEADSDGSGSITWEEFHEFTQDPHMQMYLSAHEIDITQAREIFNLIDHTGQGEVQIDEFVISLLEFRGAAKGSDVLILRNDVNKILAKLSPFIRETSKATRELKMMLVDAQLGIPPEAVDTEQTVRPSVDTSKNSRSSWFWRSRVGKGELTPPGP